MAKFSDNKKKVVNLFFNRRKERRSRYNMALKNVNIPLNIKDFPSSTTVSNCAYIGENNEIANANNILIIGNNINWKGHEGPQSNTLVVGENLTSQSGAFDDYKNQVVIGEFNEPSTTQGSYLVVGDGTGKNELAHNILVVKKGQVNINGLLNINGSLNINSSTDSSVTINTPINSDILLSNNNGIKFEDNNGPYIHVDNSSRLSISASNQPIYIVEQSNYGDSSIELNEDDIDIYGTNININGSTSITGSASISGDLTTSNDVTISGNLTVGGESNVVDLSSNSGVNLPSNTTTIKGEGSSTYTILNEQDRHIYHLFFKNIYTSDNSYKTLNFATDPYLYVQIPVKNNLKTILTGDPASGMTIYSFNEEGLKYSLHGGSTGSLSMILPAYEITYKQNSNPANPSDITNMELSTEYFLSIYISGKSIDAYFYDQRSSRHIDLFDISFDKCYYSIQ